jgi:hypothetical protein
VQGSLQRDELVYKWCRAQGASVVHTAGGGYWFDEESRNMVVQAHVNQLDALVSHFEKT